MTELDVCNITEDDINIITDDNFLDVDVKELIVDDYYLFHITDTHIYMYKDGDVVKLGFVDKLELAGEPEQSLVKLEYTSGTLRDFVDKL